MSAPAYNDAAYLQALQHLNAVFAADPFQRALDAGASWADVNEAYEAQQEARAAAQAAKPKVCPWAPKKAKRDRE
jgi:hypothetical protein